MAKIKIGQIGVGHAHASGKARAIKGSKDFEFVGVAESDSRLRSMWENDDTYAGLDWLPQEQLINDDSVQAIAIETNVPDLLDVAEACIDAGKHIHLDKPAGFSLPQFKSILDQAAKKHLIVQMGYMYRTHPGVQLLENLLEKGWLGEIFAVNAVIGKLMNESSRRGMLGQPGGIMFELGGHMLDIVLHLLGKPESIHTINQHSSPIDDGYLDNMLAVFEYATAHATLHCSCDEVDGFARRQLVVCGTEGTLEIRPMPNPSAKLALTQERGRFRKGWQEVELPKYIRYVDDIAELARQIRHEEDPRYKYEHDLLVQETLLKISDVPVD
ncbi:Gfo/Idh/MocA family protein [Thalassoglobus polymorphus]|uniref:Putative oxidoreductase YdgJ n=1 Tax=Thalassoglobus polymorphus TaxID=2527994 RepID=A0A517QUL7_9PLAN|nr:Gfo/Idh/MocA family oxidoreductase [Thalassoglobus polymorphus]QDT35332.1 putative oxidoreductase YdgJ [Thalassoglobus polymorphus]